MSNASFTRIKERAIAIVMANSAYAATVSGEVGRFADTNEFIDAALQKDAELMTAAIESGHWARNVLTQTLSSALANGDVLPSGLIGDPSNVVTSATSSGTYVNGTLASMDDVQAVTDDIADSSGIFGTASDYLGYYSISDGRVWCPQGTYTKVYYFTFTIGASPQSPESFEDAIAQGVVATLFKDGSAIPEIHMAAEQKFQQKLAEIRAVGQQVKQEKA